MCASFSSRPKRARLVQTPGKGDCIGYIRKMRSQTATRASVEGRQNLCNRLHPAKSPIRHPAIAFPREIPGFPSICAQPFEGPARMRVKPFKNVTIDEVVAPFEM